MPRFLARQLLVGAAFAVFGAAAFGAVGVNKSFTPNSVTAGQVSSLTIVLLNPNALAATGVALTDTLPANVVVANPLTIATNTCGFAVAATPGTQPVALSGGSIPGISGGAPGQCQLTINVVSSVPSTYLNTIPAGAVTSSQGTNPQAAQATLVVGAPANITATKVFAPTVVHGNGATQVSFSRLTITLANPNTIPLTNAAITDALPANITIATPGECGDDLRRGARDGFAARHESGDDRADRRHHSGERLLHAGGGCRRPQPERVRECHVDQHRAGECADHGRGRDQPGLFGATSPCRPARRSRRRSARTRSRRAARRCRR